MTDDDPYLKCVILMCVMISFFNFNFSCFITE